jgi:hypothetical protein
VLDVSSKSQPHAAAKSLYFAVSDLEAAFDRAKGWAVCRERKFMMHREAA